MSAAEYRSAFDEVLKTAVKFSTSRQRGPKQTRQAQSRLMHRRHRSGGGQAAPVRANREKALFSHIFNKARECTQNKTGARLGIEIVGELAAVVARISARPRQTVGFYLVQDDNGQPLSQFALRSRFDKARELAKISFQFRDIRAKAATDTGDLAHSQKLLAHKNRDMTEHYVRARLGERVKPLR